MEYVKQLSWIHCTRGARAAPYDSLAAKIHYKHIYNAGNFTVQSKANLTTLF